MNIVGIVEHHQRIFGSNAQNRTCVIRNLEDIQGLEAMTKMMETPLSEQ